MGKAKESGSGSGRQAKPGSPSSKIKKGTEFARKVVAVPITARERLNKLLLPGTKVAGILGMLALLGVAGLIALPEDELPGFLDEDDLPFYGMLALAFASLLGWGCMQYGLGQMREKVGWGVGGWIFVGLPIVCAVFMILVNKEVVDVDEDTGAGSWVLMITRWYPPGVIAASLIAYVATKSRIKDEGRFERGVWFLGLVAPYAVLLAYLIVGFEVPWLDDNLEDSIQDLGEGAIVLQIAIAYFLSGGGSG